MKISIITITFKDMVGLKKTLKSITDQTFGDFECLIIDGGSGPEVVQFLDNIKDPRISWVSEKDNGIFDAMNKGMEKASGDWLMFLNGGDSFCSAKTLENVAPALTNHHDLVYGNCLLEFSDGRTQLKTARHHRFVYYGMFGNHQSMLFRKDFIGGVRYKPAFRIAGDYAFTSQTIMRGAKCLRLSVPICRFDMSGVSNQQQGKGRSENWAVQRDILRVPLVARLCIRGLYLTSASAKKLVNRLKAGGSP
ncbi:glycosyltransferase family 2 protein [Rhodoferax sp. BLA1]|uniref:glycosyltransferase family 2 protein n=1 Tax=Rhodoferax sp. BLA1 TaxID=2576062 RepID=UPI0015D42EA9|nr:glycosyltransferase family 2 protein [Rhodoferax sp. BLA1]